MFTFPITTHPWAIASSAYKSVQCISRCRLSRLIKKTPTYTQENTVYVQLLALWQMAKFHAQIWQFWKSAHISETAAQRAKISSILTPWKGSICGTLANSQVGSQAECQGQLASCLMGAKNSERYSYKSQRKFSNFSWILLFQIFEFLYLIQM